MTISSVTSKIIYVGDAATATLAYPFRVLVEGDLTVSRYVTLTSVATVLTLTTDYTVTGVGDSGGGNVLLTGSYAGGMPTGSNTIIQREVTLTQATDYVENDPFPANSHENALDKLTIATQQLQEQVDRSIKADINQTSSNVIYSDYVAQATIATSSATVAVAQGAIAVSSATVSTTQATAAASSGTVCVSSSAGAVTQATAAASSGTVAVAQATLAASSGTVAVAQATAATSSATVSVVSEAAATSSSAVAVAEAAASASSATAAVNAQALVPNPTGETAEDIIRVNAGQDGWEFAAQTTGGASSLQEAFDTGQTITIADNDNQTLAITNSDVTNDPVTMTITNSTNNHGLSILHQTTVLATANHGLYVRSTAANIEPDTALAKITQDSGSSTEPALEVDNDGTGPAVQLTQDGSANALKINMSCTSDANIYCVAITGDIPSGAGTPGGIDFSSWGNSEPLLKVPADTTDPTGGGSSAAFGRIAIKDANGTTRYVPYY